jgi:hypothetical protein
MRMKFNDLVSPSHTVGLEHTDTTNASFEDYQVTIPPSGLRTPNDHAN